ncbi:hypothetical protein ACJDU8_22535 [Clostridium sp. WILCCON 0269]|uniref:Uncharacterized protein n=1 Tax=Candidatus Clostridium eludens TaxID=3381663 RepID=A0ABW8SRF0_9CLOT
MNFETFIKTIKENPKVLISVSHPIINKFFSSNYGILPKEYRHKLKEEMDEGLALDELMAALGNNFLPKDLVKIFGEGDFTLK